MINVLSLFDGIGCGLLALERVGFDKGIYFASEIDYNAIKIANRYSYNTKIVRSIVGDVRELDGNLFRVPIDLLIGGSPCQSFSNVISNNTGFEGKSGLFYAYVRILKEVKPKYFLLENVMMKHEWMDIITKELGVEPIMIDSTDFSAQSRRRLYWSNIPIPEITNKSKSVINDILYTGKIPEKYYYKNDYKLINSGNIEAELDINIHEMHKRVYNKNSKCATLTAVCGGNQQKKILDGNRVRKLLPIEYERLQTIPEDYTGGFSDSSRYKMLGNAWTVDVIAHIFKGIDKSFISAHS
jgi:DNA (cytosine-5)-methyltransferase 3A